MTHRAEHPHVRQLKNEARLLRKQNPSLAQFQALDLVAVRAGYANWRHFLNCLSTEAEASTVPVTIRMRWHADDKTSTQESLTLNLSQPLQKIFSKKDWLEAVCGQTAWIDEKTGDLVKPSLWYSQDHPESSRQSFTRDTITSIARKVLFLDATKLRPTSAWHKPMSGFPSRYRDGEIPPGFDHTKVWLDKQGRYLITIEPYQSRLNDQWPQLERLAKESGYDIRPANWPGMHNPEQNQKHGTCLVLLSRTGKGVPLDEVLNQVDTLPALYAGVWNGVTS